MMRLLFLMLLILVGTNLTQSCSIQKRKHLRGWHISKRKIHRTTAKNESTNHLKTTTKGVRKDQQSNSFIAEIKKKKQKSFDPFRIKSAILKTETTSSTSTKLERLKEFKIEDKAKIQQIQIRKSGLNLKVRSEARNEKVRWLPKLLGAFLGVLLALILIGPLFLLAIIFTDGNIEDFLSFNESSGDSPFVHAFKRCFNIVFTVGVLILFMGLIVVATIALISFLYAELGALAFLLGFLLVILAIWLMIEIFEEFTEFPSPLS